MRTAADRSSSGASGRAPRAALLLAGLAAALLGAAGCAEPVLVVDEAGPLGSAPRHYAVGSVLELRVLSSGRDVRLLADDPAVMSTTTERDGRYRLDVLATGRTVLRVVDAAEPTRVLGELPVVVEAPARARILAAAEHALGAHEPNLALIAVEGGALDVRLELFAADGAPLVGRGDVELGAISAAVVEGDQGAHQVLVLPGVARVELVARRPAGEALGARLLVLVPASAVASLEIAQGDGRASFEGETRFVVARARDAAGRTLVGAACAWSLDGVRSARTGDVLPLPASPRALEVEASFAGHTARATLAP